MAPNKYKLDGELVSADVYNKAKYEDIRLRVPRGTKDEIKAFAEATQSSINGYILQAIKERMERETAKGGPSTLAELSKGEEEIEMKCVVCYQVKSGSEDVHDKIVLSKPKDGDVDYDILHVTLPEGYEYRCNQFGEAEIYSPDGLPCHVERIGRLGKSGPVNAYPIKIGGRYKPVELQFYEEDE